MKITTDEFPEYDKFPSIPVCLDYAQPADCIMELMGIKNKDNLLKELNEDDLWLSLYSFLHSKWADIVTKAFEIYESNKDTKMYEFMLLSEIHASLLSMLYPTDIVEITDAEEITNNLSIAKENINDTLGIIKEKREEIIQHKKTITKDDLPIEYHESFDNLTELIKDDKYSQIDKYLSVLINKDNYDIGIVVSALYDNKLAMLKEKEDKIPDKDKFSIMHYEGIDPRLRTVIKEKADLSHFYAFYELLSKTPPDTMPLFDFHYEFIERYAYNFCTPKQGYLYASMVLALFYRKAGGFEHECEYPMSFEAWHRIENNLKLLYENLKKEFDTWEQMKKEE